MPLHWLYSIDKIKTIETKYHTKSLQCLEPSKFIPAENSGPLCWRIASKNILKDFSQYWKWNTDWRQRHLLPVKIWILLLMLREWPFKMGRGQFPHYLEPVLADTFGDFCQEPGSLLSAKNGSPRRSSSRLCGKEESCHGGRGEILTQSCCLPC